MTFDPCCDRRGFLSWGLGGALSLSLGGLARPVWAGDPELPGFGAAKRVVVLWLNGGPSQIETWNPLPGTPQGGPTQAIDTAAKGVRIAATLPRMAEHMQDVALIRSMATKEGNHQRARHFLHTGYVPSGTVQHPDLGALICQQKADPDAELPSYVAIAGATPGAGFLGVSLAPFTVGNPLQPVENLAYPRGVDGERFARRRKLREQLGRDFARSHPGPETSGHDAVYEKADRMMHSPRAAAFKVEEEPQALRESYGLGKFGQGCLMARRLLEQGTKVVEVQLGGWDTHKDNFSRTATLCDELDRGFSGLLADLKQRDMLKDTLVLCMGEFGRTPKINANEGRDHFARAWSLAVAGGPIQGGRVVGETSGDGMQVTKRPLNAQDLMATVMHVMGVDRFHTNYTGLGRPLTAVDESGKAIPELLA